MTILPKEYIGTQTHPYEAGKVFVEVRSGCRARRYPLEHRVLHSPDGFNWGYGGSGAVELARCLLWDFLDEQPDPEMYVSFAQTVLAFLPQNWMLPSSFIARWLEKYQLAEETMGQMPTIKEEP